MKEKKVVKRLIVIFALIIAVTIFIVGFGTALYTNSNNNRYQKEILINQGILIEEILLDYLNEDDYRNIEKIIYMASASNDFDIFISDSAGYIYTTSNEELKYMEYTKIQVDEDLQIEKINTDYMVFKNYKIESYIKPIYLEGKLEAYVIMQRKDGGAQGNILIFSILCVIIEVILATTIMVYATKRIVLAPIKNINKVAKNIVKGDVGSRIEANFEGEIGELAESFNTMADSLEKVDITRREFIANVSHELRSPLTSIRGFIGGILDGLVPKDKENYYLKIVYDEINRLNRLVNELLEISSMESGKFNLKQSEFDINSIIEVCILNLENKIKARKLDVKVTFDDKKTFVFADRDKIIQVLTNIIENAIKYGEESGEILINIEVKEDKVFISVFNSGEIFSKEELVSIWKRFYKSDKSRNHKESTGLGLSIVRLILRQHEQDIWVENVENKGVKFTFSLKKAD